MKRKTIVITCITIIIILKVVFFQSLFGAIIIHSEKIYLTEISSMIHCRLFPVDSHPLFIDGKEYRLPLPPNTAEYVSTMYPETQNGTQYITSTTNLDYYFKQTLPKYGWMLKDQMGSGFFIQRLDNNETVAIHITSFTHFYKKLIYYDVRETEGFH